ncbi:MAG: histidine phosphatase family protein [Pseudomonadales bacterium]
MNPDVVIALLRHAEYQQPLEVPSAMLPYPLTTSGFAQAESAAREILRFARDWQLELVDVIDSSHMLRAYQTASRIGSMLASAVNKSFEVAEFDALAERSVGAAANLTVTEIEQLLRVDPRYELPPEGWKADRHYRLPFQGAESLVAAGMRVATHIEATYGHCAVSGQRNLKIIVGHGASIRHAAVQLGILSSDEVASLSMFHASPIYLTRSNSGDGEEAQWRKLQGDWRVRTSPANNDEFSR